MIQLINTKTNHIFTVRETTARTLLKEDNFKIYNKEEKNDRTKTEKKEDRKSELEKLTKLELEDLGREKGLELDRRKKKEDLINELLKTL